LLAAEKHAQAYAEEAKTISKFKKLVSAGDGEYPFACILSHYDFSRFARRRRRRAQNMADIASGLSLQK
jgi:hypothetical protein